jgi:hypothetical protein
MLNVVFSTIMLNVVMLSVVMLSVIMLNVIMLNAWRLKYRLQRVWFSLTHKHQARL